MVRIWPPAFLAALLFLAGCPHELSRTPAGDLGAADAGQQDAPGQDLTGDGPAADLGLDMSQPDSKPLVDLCVDRALDMRPPDLRWLHDVSPLDKKAPAGDVKPHDLAPPPDYAIPPDLKVPLDLPPPDLPPPDLTPPDLTPPDLTPPDLTPPDLTPPPDLPIPPDQKIPCAGLTCPLGCYVALDRCYRLQPSNVNANTFWGQNLVAVKATAAGTLEFNTTNGEVWSGKTAVRAKGAGLKNGIYWTGKKQATGYPTLSVFAVDSLFVPKSTTLEVTGTLPFVLYSPGPVLINGVVMVVPTGSKAGAGGYTGGVPPGGAAAACLGGNGKGGSGYGGYQGGGSGGGRGVNGGYGGTPYKKAKGGTPGLANGPVTLVPLYGGCGGGAGGGTKYIKAGYGAGGGGAIQIASNTTITVNGIIWAPGGGGGGSPQGGGGGGGGSGGAILLEAPAIGVSGIIAANGGGGGAAGGNSSGYPGKVGLQSTAQAPGGYSASYYARGGYGAALVWKYQKNGYVKSIWGGGGGGGSGRIRINAPKLAIGANGASPAPSKSIVVGKW